jgi:nucleotide-binding universal stress UspA family protein
MDDRPRLPTVRVYDVVVGVNYTKMAEQAFHAALDIAKRRPGSRVHVIRVDEEQHTADLDPETRARTLSDGREALERYVDEQLAARQSPFNRAHLRLAVEAGVPAERIVAHARSVSAHLVVLGSKIPEVAEQAGSVAEAVQREAPCSVLIVRGRSDGTP